MAPPSCAPGRPPPAARFRPLSLVFAVVMVLGTATATAEVSILPVTGTHDDPLHFDVGDLVDFASRC